jgi:hypothetical protein
MEQEPQTTARALMSQLNERPARSEDAETAIAAYRMASWAIRKFDVARAILDQAQERYMVLPEPRSFIR